MGLIRSISFTEQAPTRSYPERGIPGQFASAVADQIRTHREPQDSQIVKPRHERFFLLLADEVIE